MRRLAVNGIASQRWGGKRGGCHSTEQDESMSIHIEDCYQAAEVRRCDARYLQNQGLREETLPI